MKLDFILINMQPLSIETVIVDNELIGTTFLIQNE